MRTSKQLGKEWHHARKSNAADGQKDPQIHKRICETPH